MLNPGLYNYWIVIFLMMTGLYMVIARDNLIKKLIGLNVFQVSVFMLFPFFFPHLPLPSIIKAIWLSVFIFDLSLFLFRLKFFQYFLYLNL